MLNMLLYLIDLWFGLGDAIDAALDQAFTELADEDF